MLKQVEPLMGLRYSESLIEIDCQTVLRVRREEAKGRKKKREVVQESSICTGD